MMNVTTSIVMPAYNSSNFIRQAIQSVQEQTFGAWELLVCDDGSSDDTPNIIERFSKHDSRIIQLQMPANVGPAVARNTAISSAVGRYIAFLDSDDLWKPEKLERQLFFMQKNDLPFTFSSYDLIDEAGNFIGTHHVDAPVTYHDLLKSCVIGCLTAVYDTEKLGKIYMPEGVGAEDFGLWLSILKKVDYAVPLSMNLAQYRVRINSISANKYTAAKYTWSIYRDVEKLNLFRASYYFSHYAINGVLKTYVRSRLRNVST